jgi:hypothetical protein
MDASFNYLINDSEMQKSIVQKQVPKFLNTKFAIHQTKSI